MLHWVTPLPIKISSMLCIQFKGRMKMNFKLFHFSSIYSIWELGFLKVMFGREEWVALLVKLYFQVYSFLNIFFVNPYLSGTKSGKRKGRKGATGRSLRPMEQALGECPSPSVSQRETELRWQRVMRIIFRYKAEHSTKCLANSANRISY